MIQGDNQQERLKQDLHWLGGIIDGEGMITAMTRSDSKTPTYIPRISISNSDTTIIEECRKILVTLGVAHYIQKKEYTILGKRGRPKERIKYEILINGYKRNHKALPILLPYIRSKHRRAELLLDLVRSRLSAPHRSPYTAHEIHLVKRIRLFNKNGTEGTGSILRD